MHINKLNFGKNEYLILTFNYTKWHSNITFWLFNNIDE